jgi:hypothetical protein
MSGRATFFHPPTLFDTREAINIKNIQELGTKSIESMILKGTVPARAGCRWVSAWRLENDELS